MKKPRRNIGWIVYILMCKDGKFITGMTRNIRKVLAEYNLVRKGKYNLPGKIPVRVVFSESQIPFKEAMAKRLYLIEMNTKLKMNLIRSKRWPNGGPLKEYKNNTKREVVSLEPLDNNNLDNDRIDRLL